MKKSIISAIILILLVVAAVMGWAVFVKYKNVNNEKLIKDEQGQAIENLTPKFSIADFNPASLSWEQATSSVPWQGRDSQAVVVYKDKIWLMGGVDATKRVMSPGNVDYGNAQHLSDVWSSEDGLNWQKVSDNAPWGERRSMGIVNFKGKMWLMGGWGPEIGYKTNIWSSEDGVVWKMEAKSASWPSREGNQLLVFQNKIWMIGGVKYDSHQVFADVWSSEDGVNWKEETKDAGWAPRWDQMCAVFDNKLWMVGGMDLKGNVFKDVWSSEDGINWSLVSDKPPFESRQGHALVDYGGKLWVIGRLNIPSYGNGANDVWYSADGVNWQKTLENPLWTGREDAGVVVFKDKIWIMGGMDTNWKWTNDVWHSTSNLDTKTVR